MKLEEMEIKITDQALEYIHANAGENLGLVISYNEVINWCGSGGEWLAVSLQNLADYDSDAYVKVNSQGIEVLFQRDAYFMVSGLHKITICLSQSPYGTLLTIKEFDPSLN